MFAKFKRLLCDTFLDLLELLESLLRTPLEPIEDFLSTLKDFFGLSNPISVTR